MKIEKRPWRPQDLIDDLQSIIDEEMDNYLNTKRTTHNTLPSKGLSERVFFFVAKRFPQPGGVAGTVGCAARSCRRNRE